MDQFNASRFKWLIIEIVRATLRAANTSHLQLKGGRADLIYLQQSKPVIKPDSYTISIPIKNELFSSVYSHAILDDILNYNFNSKNQQQINQWLLYLSFRYSPKYFTTSLKNIISLPQKP
jgi:hypothetical protein